MSAHRWWFWDFPRGHLRLGLAVGVCRSSVAVRFLESGNDLIWVRLVKAGLLMRRASVLAFGWAEKKEPINDH